MCDCSCSWPPDAAVAAVVEDDVTAPVTSSDTSAPVFGSYRRSVDGERAVVVLFAMVAVEPQLASRLPSDTWLSATRVGTLRRPSQYDPPPTASSSARAAAIFFAVVMSASRRVRARRHASFRAPADPARAACRAARSTLGRRRTAARRRPSPGSGLGAPRCGATGRPPPPGRRARSSLRRAEDSLLLLSPPRERRVVVPRGVPLALVRAELLAARTVSAGDAWPRVVDRAARGLLSVQQRAQLARDAGTTEVARAPGVPVSHLLDASGESRPVGAPARRRELERRRQTAAGDAVHLDERAEHAVVAVRLDDARDTDDGAVVQPILPEEAVILDDPHGVADAVAEGRAHAASFTSSKRLGRWPASKTLPWMKRYGPGVPSFPSGPPACRTPHSVPLLSPLPRMYLSASTTRPVSPARNSPGARARTKREARVPRATSGRSTRE